MPNENDGYSEALFGKREQAPMLTNIPVRTGYDEGFEDPRLFNDLPVRQRVEGQLLFDDLPTPGQGVSYKERVKAEREELALKIDALRSFKRGEIFPNLSERERGLFDWQESAMCTYLSALDARIALWETA